MNDFAFGVLSGVGVAAAAGLAVSALFRLIDPHAAADRHAGRSLRVLNELQADRRRRLQRQKVAQLEQQLEHEFLAHVSPEAFAVETDRVPEPEDDTVHWGPDDRAIPMCRRGPRLVSVAQDISDVTCTRCRGIHDRNPSDA